MKITAIETIRIAERPNLLWLRVETDDGPRGLGETFFGASAVEAWLHEEIAPRILGEDPTRIEALARRATGYIGDHGTGVEMRAVSALDIALWDLLGRATGRPLAELLGGFTRREIETYNTCAGPGYIKEAKGQSTDNYALGIGGPLDDLTAFMTDAGELAQSLLAEGITGMKIWPFDAAAEKSGGRRIETADLKAALRPFEQIRAAVGDRMRIMVELHGLWQLMPALEIARALAPFDATWHEDPIAPHDVTALARYAAASPAPVAASEKLGGLAAFRDVMAANAAGVIIVDLSWCGGLTTARKIAAMAEAHQLPIAPHDCTGPVVLAASTHLSLAAPNAFVQESVRAFTRGWYRDVVTAVPPVKNGFITVPDGPGHGLDLLPDIDRAFTVSRRRSTAG